MELTQHPLVQAIAILELQPGDRILELGCGDGWACRLLAEQIPGGLVIGLDASADQIRLARLKSTSFDNLLFLWSTAEQIPWQEDFFTRALCVDSADHFQDLEKVFREAHRVLVPEGTLWIINQLTAAENAGNNPSHRPVDAKLRGSEQYIALLRATGFEDIVSHALHNPDTPSPTSPDELGSPAASLLLSARKPQE